MTILTRKETLQIVINELKGVLNFDSENVDIDSGIHRTDIMLPRVIEEDKELFFTLCSLTSVLISVCSKRVSMKADLNFFGQGLHRVILRIHWGIHSIGSDHEYTHNGRKRYNKNNNP